jgi:hypothetical protein
MTGFMTSLMRRAYSTARPLSDTPRAKARARRLATTLQMMGMSEPRTASKSRMG